MTNIPIWKIAGLNIRTRERRGYVKEVQGYTSWTEYQVIKGRTILQRFDTMEAAERFATERVGGVWRKP